MFRKFILLVACLFLPTMVFASEKIYVQLDDLIFNSSGIWFKNGGEPVTRGAAAIHVDSLGYYMAKDEQTWICSQCTYVNKGTYPGFWGCLNCGFPFR